MRLKCKILGKLLEKIQILIPIFSELLSFCEHMYDQMILLTDQRDSTAEVWAEKMRFSFDFLKFGPR